MPNKGFTLMEVAVSLALIATVLLVVFRLQARNLELQAAADFATVSELLLRERLSRIEAEGDLRAGGDSGDFGEEYPAYSYREEIRPVPGEAHLFRVWVTIFREEGGRTETLAAETLRYRRP